MGLDYIRSETGKSWRKRWNGGLDRLKSPTLFDMQIGEHSRTVTAELIPGTSAKAGDSFIVQSSGDGFAVTRGFRVVGSVRHAPAEAIAAVNSSSGFAEGIVERVSLFGDTVELRLK